MNFVLGLDLGITSVGWAVLNMTDSRIERMGVRTFDAGENPKDGSSLALPRRVSRGQRRRLSRRKKRLDLIKQHFLNSGLVSKPNWNEIFKTEPDTLSPWELRKEGLERRLTPNEWVRTLYTLAKRRGYKSNRKHIESDAKSESGVLNRATSENMAYMKENQYRTIGEMFALDKKFQEQKRNKSGSYVNSVLRSQLVEEIEVLFSEQKKFGNPYSNDEFKQEYLSIFSFQRPFAKGDDIKKMVGHCTFEPEELRCSRNTYTNEIRTVWEKLNNLSISYPGKKKRFLDLKQKKIIIQKAHEVLSVKYSWVRKALDLTDEETFVGLTYDKESKKAENSIFVQMKGFYQMKKVISEKVGSVAWVNMAKKPDLLDSIATILTYYKTDSEISEKLSELLLTSEEVTVLLHLEFKQFSHLSLKALKRILPYLKQEYKFSEACEKVGYNHSRPYLIEKEKFLPLIPKEAIRNPVVIRALTQARKVLNALIREYGSFESIHVELARDLSRPYSERKQIKKEQEKYQSLKKKLEEEFFDKFGYYPNGKMLTKYRLYKEQGEKCAYSGKYIRPEWIKNDGYLEVDHILPFSRSWDDSLSNKVVCLTEENRNKGNRTPYEYFMKEKGQKKWDEFVINTKNNHTLSRAKKAKLMKPDFLNKEAKDFLDRNLNDTRYISRFLMNFIEDGLVFAGNSKRPVVAVNGRVTAFLRARWGLLKSRQENVKHHAMDAAVVAAANRSVIKRVSDFSRKRELTNFKIGEQEYVDPVTGEIVDTPYRKDDAKHFPLPWESFRDEVEAWMGPHLKESLARIDRLDPYFVGVVSPIFVSTMPRRKISGQAHEETIRSKKYLSKNISIVKTPLSNLNQKKLQSMFDKENNQKLFNAIKTRLEEHDDNPKKAFEQPLYKPTNNSSKKGPKVKGIKLVRTQNTGININKGIADNGDMVRVDIFTKKSKFYVIPVYVADFKKNKLPNKAIVPGKNEIGWTPINSTYQFLFSLYKNDFVAVQLKEAVFEGYYKSCDRSNGLLKFMIHDQSQDLLRKGVKTAISIKKYEIDMLGNRFEVKKELRHELENSGS
jgi:CRISPR-associated endonuclease Csn1